MRINCAFVAGDYLTTEYCDDTAILVRTFEEDRPAAIGLTPKTARKLAKELKRWANEVAPKVH